MIVTATVTATATGTGTDKNFSGGVNKPPASVTVTAIVTVIVVCDGDSCCCCCCCCFEHRCRFLQSSSGDLQMTQECGVFLCRTPRVRPLSTLRRLFLLRRPQCLTRPSQQAAGRMPPLPAKEQWTGSWAAERVSRPLGQAMHSASTASTTTKHPRDQLVRAKKSDFGLRPCTGMSGTMVPAARSEYGVSAVTVSRWVRLLGAFICNNMQTLARRRLRA